MSTPTSEFILPLRFAPSPEGAANLVERVFGEGRPDQYKRELVWNGVQAGAHNILMTAVRLSDEVDGVTSGIKAAFVDDGEGMSSTKILDYIGELFNGKSAIALDGNFQMGARVSTLPFNPEGVIVASWTEDEPQGTLLHIAYDAANKSYAVRTQFVEGDDGEDYPTETGVPAPYLRHPIVEKAGHGTVFILLGDSLACHTVGEITRDSATNRFIYPDRRDTRVDQLYVNSKWWSLPDGVSVKTMWGPSDLNGWIEKPVENEAGWMEMKEVTPQGAYVDGFAIRHFREYKGVSAIVDQWAVENAKATESGDHGSVEVRSDKGYRATVYWALFGEAKFIHTDADGEQTGGASDSKDYGIPLGLFAEKAGSELYNVHGLGDARVLMERYGIGRRQLRDRMVIVVEPAGKSRNFIGAHASSARDRLIIANDGLPHAEWGRAFADKMPKAIKDRLALLNGEDPKDAVDRQKRLRDRLREFFAQPVRKSTNGAVPVEKDSVPHGVPRSGRRDDDTTPKPSTPGPKRPATKGQRYGADDRPSVTGTVTGSEDRRASLDRKVTVRWDNPAAFVDQQGMIAHWLSSTRELYMNADHPIVTALIAEETKERRKDRHGEIITFAHDAIGDHLVAIIVGAEMFVRSRMTGGQALSAKFVEQVTTDESLTAACLDVATMQTIIRTKFSGRVGYKRLADVTSAVDDVA